MALTTQQKRLAWRWSLDHDPTLGTGAFTKVELDAAAAATDAWIETNQGATTTGPGFNAALPVAFRNGATAAQKTLLFCAVAMARAGLV